MQHAWRYPAGIVLGLLLCGSCRAAARETAPADAATGAQGAWLEQAVASLSAMPDTDSLVTAAVLARQLPDAQARAIDLLDRAAASAPQAADVGLLDITLCSAQTGCDALKREARLRHLDPRNGSLWMVALHDASMRNDRPRIDSMLSRMAQGDRFDVHFISLGQRFLVALKRIPPPPGATGTSADSLRRMQAMALVAAFVLPPMQDLVEACKPGNPVSDARRKTCRAIADSLRRSDTLIADLIGLRLQEWTARDTADKDDALARRRRLLWKMHQLNDVSGTAAMPPAGQIGIMLAHENEVEGIDAVLLATARPLDPPAHWQPPRPASASTLQTRH
ncbi:hypothetical protein [Rhodanobacter sp. B05]|uniref:hypothetical protein n=1 Tax=Rhodanobacter sp. B05 TaxID=1945859 RepID=UPI001115980B|nr:hypothetical protein [Rhodanobacter sp. B05]